MTLLPLMKIPQTKSSSCQQNAVSYHIITEILSWLPVKALIRLKCVSKFLNSQISDPYFVNLHLQRSARNIHMIHVFRSGSNLNIKHLLSQRFGDYIQYELEDKSHYTVAGSCNGLLCLYSDPFTTDFRDYKICLCNPATKLTSEKFPFLRTSNENERFMFAFGYDNVTATYKVVAYHIVKFGLLDPFEVNEGFRRSHVKVLSIGSDNNWRIIESFPVRPLFDFHNEGVHLNGTINWLAVQDNVGSDRLRAVTRVDQVLILSLDLVTETYKQLKLPCGFVELPTMEEAIAIDVLKDCLCFSHDSKRTHFVIWLMKEFGMEESWTQFLKISYEDLLPCYTLGYVEADDFQLLPLLLSENDDTLTVAHDQSREVIIFNCKDGRVEDSKCSFLSCEDARKDYFESLVWPC